MSPEIQIALNLCTILLSGVVSAFVTYKLSSKRERRELLRKKIEECYDAVHRYGMMMNEHHVHYVHALMGTWTWDEASDRVLKGGKDDDDEHWPAAKKLINIYFPKLRGQFTKLVEIAEDLHACKTAARRAYELQEDTSAFIPIYQQLVIRLEKQAELFNEELYSLSRRI